MLSLCLRPTDQRSSSHPSGIYCVGGTQERKSAQILLRQTKNENRYNSQPFPYFKLVSLLNKFPPLTPPRPLPPHLASGFYDDFFLQRQHRNAHNGRGGFGREPAERATPLRGPYSLAHGHELPRHIHVGGIHSCRRVGKITFYPLFCFRLRCLRFISVAQCFWTGGVLYFEVHCDGSGVVDVVFGDLSPLRPYVIPI